MPQDPDPHDTRPHASHQNEIHRPSNTTPASLGFSNADLLTSSRSVPHSERRATDSRRNARSTTRDYDIQIECAEEDASSEGTVQAPNRNHGRSSKESRSAARSSRSRTLHTPPSLREVQTSAHSQGSRSPSSRHSGIGSRSGDDRRSSRSPDHGASGAASSRVTASGQPSTRRTSRLSGTASYDSVDSVGSGCWPPPAYIGSDTEWSTRPPCAPATIAGEDEDASDGDRLQQWGQTGICDKTELLRSPVIARPSGVMILTTACPRATSIVESVHQCHCLYKVPYRVSEVQSSSTI